jgi:hypothetical protein
MAVLRLKQMVLQIPEQRVEGELWTVGLDLQVCLLGLR